MTSGASVLLLNGRAKRIEEHDRCGYSADADTFKPSAWYFRKAIRESGSRQDAIEIGPNVVLELEVMKSFIRSWGMVPTKRNVLWSEFNDKDSWADAEAKLADENKTM